jgi:hypothetical protein
MASARVFERRLDEEVNKILHYFQYFIQNLSRLCFMKVKKVPCRNTYSKAHGGYGMSKKSERIKAMPDWEKVEAKLLGPEEHAGWTQAVAKRLGSSKERQILPWPGLLNLRP